MLKKTLFLAPLALLFLTLTFWQPAKDAAIKKGIKSYLDHHFGDHWKIDQIQKEGDAWIFENTEINQGNTHLFAEKITCKVTPELRKRTIHLNIFVDEAKIHLKNDEKKTNSFLKNLTEKLLSSRLIKVDTEITINKGTIFWDETHKKEQKANFQCSATINKEKKSATTTLFFDENEKTSNLFTLSITEEKQKPLESKITFHNVDCEKIESLYNTLENQSHNWRVLKGSIDGNISFQQPKNKRDERDDQAFVCDDRTAF